MQMSRRRNRGHRCRRAATRGDAHNAAGCRVAEHDHVTRAPRRAGRAQWRHQRANRRGRPALDRHLPELVGGREADPLAVGRHERHARVVRASDRPRVGTIERPQEQLRPARPRRLDDERPPIGREHHRRARRQRRQEVVLTEHVVRRHVDRRVQQYGLTSVHAAERQSAAECQREGRNGSRQELRPTARARCGGGVGV